MRDVFVIGSRIPPFLLDPKQIGSRVLPRNTRYTDTHIP